MQIFLKLDGCFVLTQQPTFIIQLIILNLDSNINNTFLRNNQVRRRVKYNTAHTRTYLVRSKSVLNVPYRLSLRTKRAEQSNDAEQ